MKREVRETDAVTPMQIEMLDGSVVNFNAQIGPV
jgi:hypothetical protein